MALLSIILMTACIQQQSCGLSSDSEVGPGLAFGNDDTDIIYIHLHHAHRKGTPTDGGMAKGESKAGSGVPRAGKD